MNLKDLTDPDAVKKAIAECDKLGRDAFLKKYDHAPAKSIWLVYDGKRYDSKAITGVALSYQHPSDGSLKNSDFSGGDRVEKKLEALGFTIEKEGSKQSDGELSAFNPSEGAPLLRKQVGTSQHTDGVRIEKEFHDIFNPPETEFYVERGTARKISVLFNNRLFEADYRYEGQTDTTSHLESIRFQSDLKSEFKQVFPQAVGEFTIAMGQDPNHFVFGFASNASEAADEDEAAYAEGASAYRKHKVIERNPEVVKKAKEKHAKENDGRLICEVCNFDFFKAYGDRGQGFAEGHHKKPVSEMKAGDETKVEDIAIVCSNCHRMIHRKPIITVEELREELQKSG